MNDNETEKILQAADGLSESLAKEVFTFKDLKKGIEYEFQSNKYSVKELVGIFLGLQEYSQKKENPCD